MSVAMVNEPEAVGVIHVNEARPTPLTANPLRRRGLSGVECHTAFGEVSAGDRLQYRGLRHLLIAIDVSAAIAVWSTLLVAVGREDPQTRLGLALLLAVAIALVVAVLNAAQLLYRARVCAVRSTEVARLTRTCVICGLAAAWLLPTLDPGFTRGDAAVGVAITTAVLVLLRGIYAGWLRACRARGRFLRRVCILGTNEDGKALVELLESADMNYVIVGAGASGLYTALRLLRDGNLQPGDAVQVYEWSHRPGGRIYTYTFPPDLER